MASSNTKALEAYEAKLNELAALEARRAELNRELGMSHLKQRCATIVAACTKMAQGTATEADIQLFWDQIRQHQMQKAIRAVYPQTKS